MFSSKSFAAATAAFSLIASSTAAYDPTSKANVAMYWGAGSGQAFLSNYCDQTTLDIIPIAFINNFPPQANGIVGANYGNQCGSSYYQGPGYPVGVINPANNDKLPSTCWPLQQDIAYCQQKTNKKILLSLGGAAGYGNYDLATADDGIYLANWIWGAYGPYNQTWVDNGGLRPLDRGADNATLADKVDIDGFDFDIEQTTKGNQVGYIACIKRLRDIFTDYKKQVPCSKDYIISGAPQCPFPETNMGATIAEAKFDILWVQFYNNDANGCSARKYISDGLSGNFNLDNRTVHAKQYGDWVSTIAGGASCDAKIYMGLLGGPTGSSGSPNDFLTPAEAKVLIDAYQGVENFGGVMLWEATAAAAVDMSVYPGYTSADTYWSAIKHILEPYAPLTTSTSSICVSTTSSSSSSSKTSSSTSTTSSSTTTTSTTSTSSAVSSTSSTSSSTSTKPTSTSTSSSSSSSTSQTSSTNSPVSSTASSSSSSSSSSTSTTATSSSTSVTSYNVTPTTSSTSTSTAESSSSSSSSASSSVPPSSSSTPTESSSSSVVTSSSSSVVSATPSSSATSASSSATSSSSLVTSSESGTVTSVSSTSSASVSATPSSSGTSVSVSATPSSSGTSVSASSTPSSSPITSSESASITSASSSSIFSSESGTVTSVSSTSVISLPPFSTSSLTLPPTSTSSLVSVSPTPTSYTTSTVVTTSVYTITSCAPTVTDCPARIGQLTTEVITLYTTVCPVTATETGKGGFTYSSMAPAPTTTQYTTSTVYTTKVYTITSCAPTVTDCPARLGSVTTEVIKLYTTVCPVSEAAATSVPVKAISTGGVKEVASSTISHSTKHITTTLYKTVVMVQSTATVVPTSAPYPTGSASSKPFGTGLPSVSLVYQKQASTSTAAGAAGTTTAAPVPTTFAGAASSSRGGMGVMIAVIVGAVAFLI